MNLSFDFSAPPVDPQQVKPCAPIAPSADRTAKHCSYMGALKVEHTRQSLFEAMLVIYRAGPASDAEIASDVSYLSGRTIAPSTISARRKELITQGLVDPVSCGTRKNPRTGVSNSLWQLKGSDG